MCTLSASNAMFDITDWKDRAVVAYKVVKVTRSGRWRSLGTGPNALTYAPGKTFTSHVTPSLLDHYTGIFAYRTLGMARAHHTASDHYGIVRVKLWGRVAFHADGYRAEYCKVLSKRLINRRTR